MDNDAIIRRLPHLKFDIGNTLDQVETMTEELAAVPSGHERSNQIKQQMHSKIGEVRRAVDEVQPEPQSAGPAKADVVDDQKPATADNGVVPQPVGETERGNSFNAIPSEGADQHEGAGDLSGLYGSDTNATEPAPAAHEVVEMEKKINGEWLAVTVWATSAPHLEADGWSKVGDPRPVEDGEKPVESEHDETDHSEAE